MAEITTKQAVEIIEDFLKVLPAWNINGDMDNEAQAFKMAIEALKEKGD